MMKAYRILFTITAVLIGAAELMAQPNLPGQPAPIDGGVGFLLAAGAAYGVKKYRDHKRDDQGE